MSDLIDRAEALKCLEITGDYATLNEVHERLSKLPSVLNQTDTDFNNDTDNDAILNDSLISRQAAINCIEGKIKLPYDTDTGELWKYLQGVVDAIEKLPSVDRTVQEFADRCRECGKNYQGWISTSKRLPEEGLDVLACFYNGEGNYKMMVSRRSDYNYWSGVGRTADMVAWMPLPKPYKGVSEE